MVYRLVYIRPYPKGTCLVALCSVYCKARGSMFQRAWFISLGCILIFSLSANAQHWELGGAGGFGKYRNASVTSPAGTADIGIATQAAGSVVIGENLYRRLGGEFRYTF